MEGSAFPKESVHVKQELSSVFALAEEGAFAEMLQGLLGVSPQDIETVLPDTTSAATLSKRQLPDSDAEQQALGKVPKTLDSAASCASFQAYVDTLPWYKAHPSLNTAVQLRLVCGEKERTIVVAGTSSMNKLNQYISEVFDVGQGNFSSGNAAGTVGPQTRFIVSRPLGPGKCEDVLVCGKNCAKRMQQPFVDHAKIRIGHVWRGMEDGSVLFQEEHDLNMSVTFFNPRLPGDAVSVVLEGIMWNKADLPRHCNTEPLPRIVAFSSDYSEREAMKKNEKMADGRGHFGRHALPWGIHETQRKTDDWIRLIPLFRPDGIDYRWNGCLLVGGLVEGK